MQKISTSLFNELDETEYLFSSKANKETLMHGKTQVDEGKPGKTISISELWK